MAQEGAIEVEGKVVEVMRNANFKVEVKNARSGNVHVVLAYLSGKLYKNNIKVLEGDMVKIELSPYDLTKGRIVWRSKGEAPKPPQQ
ncbi:MAG: translation initiation factor IF-1 [Firmicutes bacterium]|nr:translation initiation factor IF-1 [Bacillota bacterium]